MSDHEHWQLNGSAAELYERYLVPAITSIWAADLINRAPPSHGDWVLDVACGTGAVTRLVAERIARGRIVGLDYNPGMLAVARSVSSTGPLIEWQEGSALNLPFKACSFDLVLCQLGLQFFPDRPLALREMRRVLAPGGRVGLSVFSAIERTPVAHAFANALEQSFGPNASRTKRAEHMFAKEQEVHELMTDAGFDQVKIIAVTKHITFPSVRDYVRFQLCATPMADFMANLSDDGRDSQICHVDSDTLSLLDPKMLSDGGRLISPQEAFVATALRLD